MFGGRVLKCRLAAFPLERSPDSAKCDAKSTRQKEKTPPERGQVLGRKYSDRSKTKPTRVAALTGCKNVTPRPERQTAAGFTCLMHRYGSGRHRLPETGGTADAAQVCLLTKLTPDRPSSDRSN